MTLQPRPVLHTLALRIDPLRGHRDGLDLGLVKRILPTVRLSVQTAGEDSDLDHRSWQRPDVDLWAFDRALDRAVGAARPLVIRAPAPSAAGFAVEVLTRSQRRIERRNAASGDPAFDRVLEAHATVHDRAHPIALADHDLALDRWQWTLRLDPSCPIDVQLAALVLGLEPLARRGRAGQRGRSPEAPGPDDEGLAARVLARAEVAPALRRSVRSLVALAEASPGPGHARTLADAEALSFLSISSPGFVDFFGAAWARRRVASAIAAMSRAALDELPRIRLRADVASMVAESLGTPMRCAVG